MQTKRDTRESLYNVRRVISVCTDCTRTKKKTRFPSKYLCDTNTFFFFFLSLTVFPIIYLFFFFDDNFFTERFVENQFFSMGSIVYGEFRFAVVLKNFQTFIPGRFRIFRILPSLFDFITRKRRPYLLGFSYFRMKYC